jgi:hypothetical protein
MAYASPGIDTSTDPEAHEKNPMVLTIFEFNILCCYVHIDFLFLLIQVLYFL